ncbi:MAG TPA: Xaa-Pro aminopeptidase [Verrucomicrobiae bacterium]
MSSSAFHTSNRERLKKLLPPKSLAVLNANDVLPTNADGTLRMTPNSDLLYLSGVEQEQSILVLFPDADDEKHRELLFLREPTSENQLWEGRKLTRKEAEKLSGVKRVHWLADFPRLFHRLMCECESVYLNSNEHQRAVVEIESRDARFVADTIRRYPLHRFHRLAPLMHQLRVAKTAHEIALIKQACSITEAGFRRVLNFAEAGKTENGVEAEFAHEFISSGAKFAYPPIIASGANALHLHYISNRDTCRSGDLLLLDVAASWANYNADMTRTIPVNGRFSRRQRQVYDAVLRVFRQAVDGLRPGKFWKDWQREAEQMIESELVRLGLITVREIKRQNPDEPAFKKHFMHGVGHPIGLDVHDVGFLSEPMQAGWAMTVEPAIYIPKEKFAVRLENTVVIGEKKNIDLMASIPIEAEEIEELMNRNRKK